MMKSTYEEVESTQNERRELVRITLDGEKGDLDAIRERIDRADARSVRERWVSGTTDEGRTIDMVIAAADGTALQRAFDALSRCSKLTNIRIGDQAERPGGGSFEKKRKGR